MHTPPKILIVEDEMIVAEDISKTLEKIGYKVTGIAPSRRKAIHQIKQIKPDLVLMDIVLQGTDNGIELAETIYNEYNIPVVYLTAYIDKKTIDRAKMTRPYGYIPKPFEKQILESTIEIALYKHDMEQRLRASEAWFFQTLSSIGDGVIATDREAKVMFINPVAEELTGWKLKKAQSRPLRDVFSVINPKNGRKIQVPIARVIKTGEGKSFTDQTLLVGKDLRKIPIEQSCGPIKNSRDEVIGMVIVFRDISELIKFEHERKMAEKALRESESRYRFLYEESPTISMIVDMNGKIKDINRALMKTLGYSKEDLIGRSVIRFILPEDRQKVIQNLRKDLKNKETHNNDLRVYDKHRVVHTILFSPGQSVIYEKDRLTGVLVTGIDLTERKRTAEELEDSREQLRNLARHLQFVREQERTSIARRIHDELGQVMTALKMDLSWIKKRLGGDAVQIFDKLKSMSKIIDHAILTVQHISTELRPGLLDDLGLTAAIEWQTQEFQERTGIQSEVHFNPEEIVLDYDRSTEIFRIFQELLTNVARHSKATKVVVDLTVLDQVMKLVVKDNGIGIQNEKIIDPKSFGLVGIRERVYPWNGEVIIEGKSNQGTTALIKIPLDQ